MLAVNGSEVRVLLEARVDLEEQLVQQQHGPRALRNGWRYSLRRKPMMVLGSVAAYQEDFRALDEVMTRRVGS